METLEKNTEVAYQKNCNEYQIGICQSSPNYNNRVLVKFNTGYSRWINSDNLIIVTKSN